MNRTRKTIGSTLVATSLGVLLTTGCATNFGALSNGSIDGNAAAGIAISGKAYGGQQPISGATIQLYAVGTTGYGSAATPLLTGTAVKSNILGGFTIPANAYTCPAGSYVYLTATGGDPGLGTGSNAAIAELAAVGACSSLSSSTFININEATTVAGVWAMAQFGATSGTPLSGSAYPATASDTFGTSATNIQGMANAMAIANILVNTGTGASPGANTSGTQYNVEYWHINTLANILAACVNSAGAAGASCGTLFSNTGNATDTIQAALYMAKNPASNVTTIAGVATATPPFMPTDTSTNDFTIGLSYQTGTTATRWIAIDQFGNAWVATGGASVYELDPTGNTIATPASYSLSGTSTAWKTSYQVAVDTANNAWFVDQGTQAVVEVVGSTSAGGANGGAGTATATGTTNTAGTAKTIDSVVVDGKNNVWVANSSGNTSGLLAGSYGTVVIGGTNTSSPFGLAVDLSNNPASPNYTASNGGSFIYGINSGGCTNESLGGVATVTVGSLDMDYTVAGASNAAGAATPLNYIANTACATTSKVAVNSQGYVFTSVPYGIAVDNSNNLWIVNQNYVTTDTSGPKYSFTKATTNYSTSFTAANVNTELSFVNYSGGGLSAPFYLAMDGAGAAWTANTTAATVSAMSNSGTALSPSTGFYGGIYSVTSGTGTVTNRRAISGARGVAVDPSGNVWVANTSTVTPAGATSAIGIVTMLVGAATPTVTPLARGIANDTLASKP